MLDISRLDNARDIFVAPSYMSKFIGLYFHPAWVSVGWPVVPKPSVFSRPSVINSLGSLEGIRSAAARPLRRLFVRSKIFLKLSLSSDV